MPALHHGHDDVFGMIVRREAAKPGDVLFLAALGGLRRAGLGRHHRALDLALAAGAAASGAALLVHHFPEPVPHDFDVLLLHFRAQVAADLSAGRARRRRRFRRGPAAHRASSTVLTSRGV